MGTDQGSSGGLSPHSLAPEEDRRDCRAKEQAAGGLVGHSERGAWGMSVFTAQNGFTRRCGIMSEMTEEST